MQEEGRNEKEKKGHGKIKWLHGTLLPVVSPVWALLVLSIRAIPSVPEGFLSLFHQRSDRTPLPPRLTLSLFLSLSLSPPKQTYDGYDRVG